MLQNLMPLAVISAPDASHPHITARFAPSLPNTKRDSLRREIAGRLKGIRVYALSNASNEFITITSEVKIERIYKDY